MVANNFNNYYKILNTMRKITFLLAALFVLAFSFNMSAGTVKTGIYLLFGNIENPNVAMWDSPVTYDKSNLNPNYEFNIDLGEGFYALELTPADLGFNSAEPKAIEKLFRAFNTVNGQLSPFGSKWVDPEKGMRFHYIPELRPENDVIKFVVNSKTLEVNWNASLAVGGRFEEYTAEYKELMGDGIAGDPEYVLNLNKEEGVKTFSFESMTGIAVIGGADYPRFAYVGQCTNKEFGMTYILSEQSAEGDGGIKFFDKQFGAPAPSAEKVPMRISFRLDRLESTITFVNNEFFIGADKFVMQGDKYIIFKSYPAGTHSVTVTTPSFDMEAGEATSFTLDAESSVKFWFYADTNPNKGNLHVEKGVKIPTSVAQAAAQSFKVSTSANSIIVDGLTAGDNVKVYNVMGAQLANEVATTNAATFDMASGVYIVTINNVSFKVVVR